VAKRHLVQLAVWGYVLCFVGGPGEVRTLDLMTASHARSQLRHRPTRPMINFYHGHAAVSIQEGGVRHIGVESGGFFLIPHVCACVSGTSGVRPESCCRGGSAGVSPPAPAGRASLRYAQGRPCPRSLAPRLGPRSTSVSRAGGRLCGSGSGTLPPTAGETPALRTSVFLEQTSAPWCQ